LPRFGIRTVCTLLPALLIMASAFSQISNNSQNPGGNPEAAVVTSVRVVHDAGAEAIEILSSHPVVPAIRSVDSPPRIVIDLPNARWGMQRKRLDILQGNILTIRTEPGQKNPSNTRIVVSFLVPYGFTEEQSGNRILVRLKPPEDPYAASRNAPVQQPKVLLTPAAAMVPVTNGLGEVFAAGRRFAAGSAITAGSETAVLQLSRGGEVRVCPGTTLSITPSKSDKDLMMGLSTGSMETHYSLGASADTVLTPDFRILFAGPGEFHYAISTDTQGNTCVRGLHGNASAAIVSELIGDRVYQVKPSEQAVFHSGRIDKVGTDVPLECGCPPPVPVERTESTPPQMKKESESPDLMLAQGNASAEKTTVANGDSPHGGDSALHPPEAGEVHVQVEAPLVFRGTKNSSASSLTGEEASALPVMESSRTVTLEARVLPPAGNPPPKHGIFHRIRGFFAAIFH
jgi:AMIN domain